MLLLFPCVLWPIICELEEDGARHQFDIRTIDAAKSQPHGVSCSETPAAAAAAIARPASAANGCVACVCNDLVFRKGN